MIPTTRAQAHASSIPAAVEPAATSAPLRARRRGWLVRRALLTADWVGLVLAYLICQALIAERSNVGHVDPIAESLLFLGALPLWAVAAKVYGLYDRDEERTDHSTVDDLVGVFHLVTVGTWLVFIGASLTDVAAPELPRLILFWGLAVVGIPVLRASARAVCRRRVEYLQNTLILGGPGVAEAIARKLRRHPEYGLNLVGFVGGDPVSDAEVDTPVLGSLADLPSLVRLYDVERVIVAFPPEDGEDVLETVRGLRLASSVQIDVVPPLYELISPGVSVHTLEGIPVVGLPSTGLPRSPRLLKRGFDLAVATLLLVAISPLLALFALLIKLDSRGPVFFRQVRIGRGEEPFEILKFRTMVRDADERKADLVHLNVHANGGDPRMFKIPDDPRITRFGRFLRRYSLDELPQLVNVMRGEMSLVGPRPLIPEEHGEVKAWARHRIALKPGMTGLWQVSGSSRIGFAEMVDLDYLYVTSWSLGRDLGLLLRTIPVVLRGSNER